MNEVAVKSSEVSQIDEMLELPRTLMGGTMAMRDAGMKFLPMERGEEAIDYASRLLRSFLFGGFERTIAIMVGEIFRKPVVVKEDNDDQFIQIANDIDLRGNNITRFASVFFRFALFNGAGFILVDTPPLPKDEDGNIIQTTVADDQELGRRVYWAHVPLDRVLGVITSDEGGTMQLLQIRIKDDIEVRDGAFGTRVVEQVKVLEPGRWQVYRKQISEKENREEWYLYDEGGTELSYIPIVPYYTGPQISYLLTKPPLQGLAELNLAHWQSSSDQSNILHFARVPILFGKGLRRDDKGDVVISPRNLFSTDNPDGDLKFVEHSGAAIGDGWKDLERLEMLMSLWGLELVAGNRPGNVTATEKALTGAKTGSFLSSAALDLQDALNLACQYTYDILGIEYDHEKQGVDVSKDFSMLLASFTVDVIIEGYKQGIIDRTTAIDELKRRGVLSDKIDPVEIANAIANESKAGTFSKDLIGL